MQVHERCNLSDAGVFVLVVLARCDSPISARTVIIAALALILVLTVEMPLKPSDECAGRSSLTSPGEVCSARGPSPGHPSALCRRGRG